MSLILSLFFSVPFTFAAEPEQIEISTKNSSQVYSWPIPPGDKQQPMGLGEELDRLKVKGLPVQAGDELIVEQRFEYSLTLQNEGPHIDLLDWKHGNGGWLKLSAVSPGEFEVRNPKRGEKTVFPTVTTAQIVQAVKKFGAEQRWVELAARCRSPQSLPCSVGVSRMFFRVSYKAKGKKKQLWTVVALPPMGS